MHTIKLIIPVCLFFIHQQLIYCQPEKGKDSPRDRYKWFFEQRTYPLDTLKQGYHLSAFEKAKSIRRNRDISQTNQLSWTPIGPAPGGLYSGRVPAIAVHPNDGNTVYIGAADGGVWKTTDGGGFWTPITDDQPTLASGSIVIDPVNPNIIYWGTGEPYSSIDAYGGAGVFKSVDAGVTWSLVGLSNEKRITKLAINPQNPDILLAATWGGIYRSSDAGVSWTKTSSFSSGWDVAIDPSDPLVCYACASGVYKSADGGLSWTKLTNGIPTSTGRLVLGLAASDPSILYVLISNATFYKSTDAGLNWTSLPIASDLFGSQGWYDITIGVSPNNPDVVLIGGISAYYSFNGGNSWTRISSGQHADCHAIAFGPGVVYLGTDGGVNRSTDNGATFTRVNANLAITQFYAVGLDNLNPNRIWGGNQDNGTQRTTGSIAWTLMIGGDGGFVNIDTKNSNIVYAERQNGYHYRTTNGGGSFLDANVGIAESGAWVTPVVLHPDSSGILYTATSKIYKSTDTAKTWFNTASSYPWGGSNIRQLAIPKTSSHTLYASPGSSLYRSTDNGVSWSNISTGLPGRTITSILPHYAMSQIIYVTVSGSGTGHIFKSTDGGESWVSINNNFPTDLPVNSIAINPSNDLNLYLATDLGIWLTEDGGTTWVKDLTFPNSAVVMLGVTSDNNLVAATHGRSMFKAALNSGPFVRVTSPNGGENWTVGTIQNITWTYNDITNVKIDYSTDNGTNWTTIAPSTSAMGGSYPWTIPNIATAQAKVRISEASNASLNDVSDAVFTISSPPAITVVTPNGGENWYVNSVQSIQWSAATIANVKIEYSTNGGAIWLPVIDATPGASGSYPWTIPGTPSNQAMVKISDVLNSETYDTSNSVFTIAPPPSITLTSPVGGEDWKTLSVHNITWIAVSIVNIKIDYSTNGGTNWISVSSGTNAGTGSYGWTVPNTPTGQAIIRVMDVLNTNVRDSSHSVFTISVAPAVQVTAPNGGESWFVGSPHNITWNAVNILTVKIEYSTDSGSSWSLVAPGVIASAGNYTWTVPNTPSTHSRVRVSDSANASVSDISDAAFSISAPTGVTVISPNGGENWIATSSHNITWTTNGLNNVRIRYSTNNGSSWQTITANAPASSGSYTWIVPNTPTTQARVLVGNTNGSISDTSDNPFTISTGATVTVLSPNGGENWTIGTSQNIRWSSLSILNINIEYSTNSGSNWNVIASNVLASNATYNWTIPNTPTKNGIIRISDASNSATYDISDSSFVISAPPAITLTSPNGGELFIADSVCIIGWTSTNIDNLRIEYSIDDGFLWVLLESSFPASNLYYVWTVPGAQTNKARVRVSEAETFVPSDQSDSVFKITQFQALTSLVVKCNNYETDTLMFGCAGGATDSVDSLFGERELTFKPPPGNFDVRWSIPSTAGIKKDIRDTLSTTSPEAVYTCELQLSPDGYPAELTWDQLGKGVWTLRDAATHGSNINIRMRHYCSYLLSDPSVTSVEIVHSAGKTADVQVVSNWNMLSLPLYMSDSRTNLLFPGTASQAYSYTESGYGEEDTLKIGQGYWLKFSEPQTIAINGDPVLIDTIDLNQGWNLIGSIASTIDAGTVTTIPSGIISSNFFGFENGTYAVADSIYPARGHWVKVSESGKMILSSLTPFISASTVKEERSAILNLNSLTIKNGTTEQRLFFGTLDSNNLRLPECYQLPPPPPAGAFDVRFGSQNLVELYPQSGQENVELPVIIQGDGKPVIIEWEIRDTTNTKFVLTDAFNGGLIGQHILSGAGSLSVPDIAIGRVLIKISRLDALPTQFDLFPNYPNPFNPSTFFAFNLPEPASVFMIVSDVLGRTVATVIDHQQYDAGRHSVEFSADNISSGIYFYSLSAQGKHAYYNSTKKMLLVR